MKLFCRHEWEYIKKPNKVVLVQCRKCGKTEFHNKDRKYIFSKLIQRTYCWCPKCNNDLVRDSFVSDEDGIVTYRCSWCGHESVWDFTFRRRLFENEIIMYKGAENIAENLISQNNKVGD